MPIRLTQVTPTCSGRALSPSIPTFGRVFAGEFPGSPLPIRDTVDWDQTSANDSEPGEPAPELEYDQAVTW